MNIKRIITATAVCRTLRANYLNGCLSITILLFFPLQSGAQQYEQYSLSMFSPLIYNPAFSGSEEAFMFQAGWRNQWMGFHDDKEKTVNPRSFFITASAPVYRINSGLGMVFSRQSLGYQERSDFRIDYSFRIPLRNESIISLGISGKISQLSLNIDNLSPFDPADPLVKETGLQKDVVPEFGTGIFYKSTKTQAGISAMNLLSSEFQMGNIILKDQMTFTFFAQHRLSIVDNRFNKADIAPSILIKSSAKSTQFDVNLLGYFNDRYWGGAGYRFQDGIILLAGAGIGSLEAGVSYDITTSRLKDATKKGSLEIQIRYGIPVYPPVLRESGFNTRHL